nr:hypothetical protein [Moraxella osloensis]
MSKSKAISIHLLILLMLTMGVSSCQADNSVSKTLYNTLQVKHDFIIEQKTFGSDQPNYDSLNDPQIFIQATTPVNCQDRGNDANYEIAINGCILKEPLPKSLTLRVGKWLSQNEQEKKFPEPPYDYYREREPKYEIYKDYNEWKKATKEYWQQVEQLPEFKSYNNAIAESIEQIQWHTITIHPQAIMDKYKGKIPQEEVKSFRRISPYLWSTDLILYITVNPDMSATFEEVYKFKKLGKPSFH